MRKIGKYNAGDSMSDLITGNYRTLLIISRFGIPLGFGDKTIEEVCSDNGVDTRTFLAVVNLILDKGNSPDTSKISVGSLLEYLHSSHDYFLKYRLPEIRRKLVEVVGSKDKLSTAVMKYFDEYVTEVNKHMDYEEKTVFPYIQSLINGKKKKNYSIDTFMVKHDHVEERLSEFKNILIKYYPSGSTNEINSVLFDIFNCENDLASHNLIEDKILIPLIRDIEENHKGS